MKNLHIEISNHWKIYRDVFYDLDPADDSISEDDKFNNLYCQEDLFLIEKDGIRMDLGWYGGESEGFFRVYLFRGDDWHNCQLLEKRKIKDYQLVLKTLNKLIKNVEMGLYDSVDSTLESIDDYDDQENVITIAN